MAGSNNGAAGSPVTIKMLGPGVAGPWDAALARCRLWVAGGYLKRDRLKGGRDLPRLLPEAWTVTVEEPKPRVPLDGKEIDLMNRTLDLIDRFGLADRLTLMGMLLGHSSASIWREIRLALRKAGEPITPEPVDREERKLWKESEKRRTRRRMQHLVEIFARRLNEQGEPVDEATRARLEHVLERGGVS